MFARGFKTWCEKYSKTLREELGVKPYAPLNAHDVAKHHGIKVITPNDIPGLSKENINILLRNDKKTPSCWSAVTLTANNKKLIILNSSHTAGRQSNDLMHELSHQVLGHEASEVSVSPEGIMLVSSYDKQQEEEADWLSASLLLPRNALVAIKKRRLDDLSAAKEYGVSVRMLKYRSAVTGVNRQYV